MAACFCACTQPAVRPAAEPAGAERRTIFRASGDTVTIAIEFSSRREQRAFLRHVDSLLASYHFDTLRADTIRHYFALRLVEQKEKAPSQPQSLGTVEMKSFAEAERALPHDSTAGIVRPQRGGSVTMYSQRACFDPLFASLAAAPPPAFSADHAPPHDAADTEQILSAQKTAGNKVRITITRDLPGAKGKRLTAFDLVEAWQSYAKKYPAEGAVMFGSIKGFDAFVRGRETVVPGIHIRDERTIVMQLERDDNDALLRLASPRLLPPSLGQGPYAVTQVSGNTWTLTANASDSAGPPYADRIVLVCGNDKTPLVSYSLNRYDMVVLTFANDLEYARRSLMKDSWLAPLPAERYFIALRIDDNARRQAVAAAIDPGALLAGSGRIEAARIAAVESDLPGDTSAGIKPAMPDDGADAVEDTARIRILFQADDPVSAKIAEKLLASLSRQVRGCRLEGLDAGRCSAALYNKEWEIAVGWAGQDVLTSEHERLRLAEVWFGGMRDEARRIREGYEVPLFGVKRYALCKNHIGLFGGDIAMVYVKK